MHIGVLVLLTSLFAITFHFHRHHHNRLTRKYLNANRPHLPCWFCGTTMTASVCAACKARNVTRDEVANAAA